MWLGLSRLTIVTLPPTEPREIEVSLDRKPSRSRLTVAPLTECEDSCWEQYLACYERCDERGDSCAICSQEYQWCVNGCPPPCTEPKSVTYYNLYDPQYAEHYGIYACASPQYPYATTGDTWERVYAHYTVYVYKRTEHCDGSYTDTFDHTTPAAGWCWIDTYQSCNSPSQSPPYDPCP